MEVGIIFSLLVTLIYSNKIQEQMSFAQRLCKVQRKASEGNQHSQVLENERYQLNLKNGRKLTEFEKHHSDLKSMLQYLECEKSASLYTTPRKNKKQQPTRGSASRNKVCINDSKQNVGTKVLFKNSPQKRLKLKINRMVEESQPVQQQKQSFLLRNLKCSRKATRQNPQNAITQPMKQSLILTTKTSRKQKKGIPNIGNTCYLNAVLQCLFHLKDFNEGFAACYSERNEILNKYMELWDGVMGRAQVENLSTLPLKKSISKMCSLFIDFHQQDAHQFLKQLLQTIHQQINRISQKPSYKILQYSLNKSNLSILSQQFWQHYKKYDNSYIYDSLCGQVCSFVTCANCKYESVGFDNFLDLSLPMVKGKSKLEELLKEYFDEEVLGDYYYCSSCKKSSKKSLKRTQIWKNPNYLILQLKRSQFGRKNIQPIQIPVRCLNLKPYLTTVQKQSRPTMYHLQGVVLHRGAIEGGHYWAHVKDGINWYSVDDQKVELLDRDNFVPRYEDEGSGEAYILFYKCM